MTQRPVSAASATTRTITRRAQRMCDAVNIDEYFANYVATGDPAIRNAIVEHHSGLAGAVAQQYRSIVGVDTDDLFEAGIEGLLNAVERYDPSYGTKFSTFAYPHIKGKVLKSIREQKGTDGKAGLRFVSIDSVSNDVDDVRSGLRNEIQRELQAPDAADAALAAVEWRDLAAWINELPADERLVILLRFGMVGGSPMTVEEVAKVLDLTRRQVQICEVVGMKRLQARCTLGDAARASSR